MQQYELIDDGNNFPANSNELWSGRDSSDNTVGLPPSQWAGDCLPSSADSEQALSTSEDQLQSPQPSESDTVTSPAVPAASQPTNGGRRYACTKCDRQFGRRDELNIHYTHTHRERPRYACDSCELVFMVKRELSTHVRIHNGEQPQRCRDCGMEFGTRQLLNKHQMVHSGVRSHYCPVCPQAFFQKGHLTQHMQIHAGVRPHKCGLCVKTFIFKFDLNRHMKIHAERGGGSGGGGTACIRCGKAFSNDAALDEHTAKCAKKHLDTGAKKSAKRRREPFSATLDEAQSMKQIKLEPTSPLAAVPSLSYPFDGGLSKERPVLMPQAFDGRLLAVQHFAGLLAAAAQKNFFAPPPVDPPYKNICAPSNFAAASLLFQLQAVQQHQQQQQELQQQYIARQQKQQRQMAADLIECQNMETTVVNEGELRVVCGSPTVDTPKLMAADSPPQFQLNPWLIHSLLVRQTQTAAAAAVAVSSSDSAATSSCASSPQKASPGSPWRDCALIKELSAARNELRQFLQRVGVAATTADGTETRIVLSAN